MTQLWAPAGTGFTGAGTDDSLTNLATALDTNVHSDSAGIGKISLYELMQDSIPNIVTARTRPDHSAPMGYFSRNTTSPVRGKRKHAHLPRSTLANLPERSLEPASMASQHERGNGVEESITHGIRNSCLYDAVCAASKFGWGRRVHDVVTAIRLGQGEIGNPGDASNIWHLAVALKRPIYVEASSACLGWVKFTPPLQLGSAIFICLTRGTQHVGHYVALQPLRSMLILHVAVVVDSLMLQADASDLKNWLRGGSSEFVRVAVRVREAPQSIENEDGEFGQVTEEEQNAPAVTVVDGELQLYREDGQDEDGPNPYEGIGTVLGSDTTQEQVYNEIGRPLLSSALGGHDVCLMAYGASGSGKTFTLTGDANNREFEGITPRLVRELFASLQQMKTELEVGHSDKIHDFRVSIRYFEVYGNTRQTKNQGGRVLDLLYDYGHEHELTLARYGTSDVIHLKKKKLALKYLGDSRSGDNTKCWDDFDIAVGKADNKVTIRHKAKVSSLIYPVGSVEELLAMKARADSLRATASHDRNAVSSRSHALFTMEIEIKSVKNSPWTKKSHIHVCDLAGFEDIKDTGAERGDDLHSEGLAITDSLKALKDVIRDRKDGKDVSAGNVRRSAVIGLLLECLRGFAAMTIIVNTSPLGGEHLKDTKKTLEFATLAKAIRQTPRRAVPRLNSEAMKDMMRRNHNLEAELKRAQEGGAANILEINKLKRELAVSTKEFNDAVKAKDDAEVSRLKQIKMNEVHNGAISKLKTIHDVLMNLPNEEIFCELGQPGYIDINLQKLFNEVKGCEQKLQNALGAHNSLCDYAEQLTESLDIAVDTFLPERHTARSLQQLAHIKSHSFELSRTIQNADEALSLFKENIRKVTRLLRSIHFSCLDILLGPRADSAQCHKLDCAAAIFSPCVPDDWEQDELAIRNISELRHGAPVTDNEGAITSDDNLSERFLSIDSSTESHSMALFDDAYPGLVFREHVADYSPADAPVIIKWTSAVLHHARRALQSWLKNTPDGKVELWEKMYQKHAKFTSSNENLQDAPDSNGAHFDHLFKACQTYSDQSSDMVNFEERLTLQIDDSCRDWCGTVKLAEDVSEAILSKNLDVLDNFTTNAVDDFNGLVLEYTNTFEGVPVSEMDGVMERLGSNRADCIKLEATFQEIMKTICVQWIKDKRLKLSDLQDAKDAEIESLQEDHGLECARLKDEHDQLQDAKDAEIESLREDHGLECTRLKEEHDQLQDAKDAEIESLREDHGLECTRLKEEHDQLQDAKNAEIESLREDHELECTRLKDEHDQLQDAKNAEIESLREDHGLECTRLKDEHDQLQDAKDAEIESLREDHGLECTRLKEEHDQLQDAKDAEIESLREDHGLECTRLKEEHDQLQEAKNAEIESLREDHELECTRLKDEHDQLQDAKNAEIESLREDHELECTRLKDEHDQLQDAKDAEIESLSEEKDGEIKSLTAERARLQEEYQNQSKELEAKLSEIEAVYESKVQLEAQIESMDEDLRMEKSVALEAADQNIQRVEHLIRRINTTYSNSEETLSVDHSDPYSALNQLLEQLDEHIQAVLPPPIAGSGLDVIRARQQERPQSINLQGGQIDLSVDVSGLNSLVENGLGLLREEVEELTAKCNSLEVEISSMKEQHSRLVQESETVKSNLHVTEELVEALRADAKVAGDTILSLQNDAEASKEGMQAMGKLSDFVQHSTAGGRPLTPMQQEMFDKWLLEAEEQYEAFRESSVRSSEMLEDARNDMIAKRNEYITEKGNLNSEFQTKTIEMVEQWTRRMSDQDAEYDVKKREVEATRGKYSEKLRTIDNDIEQYRKNFENQAKKMQADVKQQMALHIAELEAKVNTQATDAIAEQQSDEVVATSQDDFIEQIQQLKSDKQAISEELEALRAANDTREQSLRAELEALQAAKDAQEQSLRAEHRAHLNQMESHRADDKTLIDKLNAEKTLIQEKLEEELKAADEILGDVPVAGSSPNPQAVDSISEINALRDKYDAERNRLHEKINILDASNNELQAKIESLKESSLEGAQQALDDKSLISNEILLSSNEKLETELKSLREKYEKLKADSESSQSPSTSIQAATVAALAANDAGAHILAKREGKKSSACIVS